ncbi:MAG: hypothetical protein HYZ72_04460, partial [Deltaproteobacteria bacterium]|nr:hypothetical protein [Deltaproteobacteria bacterium]
QALERAFALAQHARDLDDSLFYAHQMLGILYAQKGQYDLAISETGQEEAARAEAAEILRVNPQFSLEVWRQRNPLKDRAGQERLLDALRKAGLK